MDNPQREKPSFPNRLKRNYRDRRKIKYVDRPIKFNQIEGYIPIKLLRKKNVITCSTIVPLNKKRLDTLAKRIIEKFSLLAQHELLYSSYLREEKYFNLSPDEQEKDVRLELLIQIIETNDTPKIPFNSKSYYTDLGKYTPERIEELKQIVRLELLQRFSSLVQKIGNAELMEAEFYTPNIQKITEYQDKIREQDIDTFPWLEAFNMYEEILHEVKIHYNNLMISTGYDPYLHRFIPTVPDFKVMNSEIMYFDQYINDRDEDHHILTGNSSTWPVFTELVNRNNLKTAKFSQVFSQLSTNLSNGKPSSVFFLNMNSGLGDEYDVGMLVSPHNAQTMNGMGKHGFQLLQYVSEQAKRANGQYCIWLSGADDTCSVHRLHFQFVYKKTGTITNRFSERGVSKNYMTPEYQIPLELLPDIVTCLHNINVNFAVIFGEDGFPYLVSDTLQNGLLSSDLLHGASPEDRIKIVLNIIYAPGGLERSLALAPDKTKLKEVLEEIYNTTERDGTKEVIQKYLLDGQNGLEQVTQEAMMQAYAGKVISLKDICDTILFYGNSLGKTIASPLPFNIHPSKNRGQLEKCIRSAIVNITKYRFATEDMRIKILSEIRELRKYSTTQPIDSHGRRSSEKVNNPH